MTNSTTQMDTYISSYQKVMVNQDSSNEDKKIAYEAWAPDYDEHLDKNSTPRMFKLNDTLITALKQYYPDISTLTCLDVGCGTGKPAQMAKTLALEQNMDIKFTGLDFSPAMLKVAEEKTGVYEDLIEADLSDKLPLEDEIFDSWMAGGVFLDGHVGPEVIPNITRVIRTGGIGAITIRKKTWDSQREEYEKFFKLSRMEVLSSTIELYMKSSSADVYALYIVVRKNWVGASYLL